MARNGKKNGSTWTKRDAGTWRGEADEVLPGKPGETIGQSKPPWPISEFPPFRDSDATTVRRDGADKPARK